MPTAEEELKAAQERAQKIHDDLLIERYRRYQQIAFRMIVGELKKPTPGHPVMLPSYDEGEVRHMAEMLLLLDIASGATSFSRFRARYGGNY